MKEFSMDWDIQRTERRSAALHGTFLSAFSGASTWTTPER